MQKSNTKRDTKKGQGGKSNMSMVLVMSNLMTKRTAGKKRGGKSQKPPSEADRGHNLGARNYH